MSLRLRREGRRGVTTALALTALLVAGIVAASTVAALESPNHPRLFTIASGFAAEGAEAKADPLKDACGVALDAAGRVFVSTYYERAVYIYAFNQTAGQYQFLARVNVPDSGPPPAGKAVDGPCDLAVDSAGNLYVNNWHRNVVRYAPLTATTFGPGVVIDSNHPTGVAVDPNSDRVFVDDRTSVAEYAPTALENGEPLRRIGVGEIENGYGVAVSDFTGSGSFPSTAGWVYVADAADDTVKVFDATVDPAEPKPAIDGAGTPEAGFHHLADTDLAVDPNDGHVYVVDNLQPGIEQPEAIVDEFSSRGHYRGSVPPGDGSGHPSRVIDAEPSSIAISDEGRFFLSSGNYFSDGTTLPDNLAPQDSQVQVFGPAADLETRLLTVTKSGAGVGVVFSAAGLRCGSDCEAEFTLGAGALLGVEPAPGSRFAGWTGCPDVRSDGRCLVTISADATVGAEFEPAPQQTLSVAVVGAGQGSVASAPAGIACGGSCANSFDEGSQVTLTATAFDGSAFAGWSGCDAEPAPGACVVTMSGARSVAASFAPVVAPPPPPPTPAPQRLLSVAASGLGGAAGSVTSAPGGIDCGATCTGLYTDGTTVTLEARPAAGSAFLGWGGCDASDGPRCTVALGADKVVAAAFGPGSPGPLRVRGVSVRGETATLRVVVPVAGELSATSPRLQPASALPIQAGVVALQLRLNPAGVRALARAKRGRLSVPVTLSFAPFDGGTPVGTKRAVVFGDAKASGRPARGGAAKSRRGRR